MSPLSLSFLSLCLRKHSATQGRQLVTPCLFRKPMIDPSSACWLALGQPKVREVSHPLTPAYLPTPYLRPGAAPGATRNRFPAAGLEPRVAMSFLAFLSRAQRPDAWWGNRLRLSSSTRMTRTRLAFSPPLFARNSASDGFLLPRHPPKSPDRPAVGVLCQQVSADGKLDS